MKRLWVGGALITTAACMIGIYAARPVDMGGPYPELFGQWNHTLRQATPGRDVVFVDLDALDHNIATIRRNLGGQFALRLVAKSLPNTELLRYIMERAETNRLMVFSENLLDAYLSAFGGSVEYLLGRPLPVAAAQRLLERNASAVAVQWLVDTPERLRSYGDLAEELGIRLEVVLEIDVGLRRGGARDRKALTELLSIAAAQPASLHLVGFMGYDGHVPFAPALMSSDDEFAKVQALYRALVRDGQKTQPALFAEPLVFQGGGSRTYFRYTDGLRDTPINDIAIGSAFLSPAAFGELKMVGHRPALFFASPVVKKQEVARVPFVYDAQPWSAWWNPNHAVGFFMLGGGFPADAVAPPGLVANPFIGGGGGGVRNLVSTQALLNGSKRVGLNVGDFVFFHAWEADAVAWTDRVFLMRNHQIIGSWANIKF